MPDLPVAWIVAGLTAQALLASVLAIYLGRRTKKTTRREYADLTGQLQRDLALSRKRRLASAEASRAVHAQLPQLAEPDRAGDPGPYQANLQERQSVLVTEMAQLVHANQRLQQDLASARIKLKKQAKKLARYRLESRTDPLTRLLNRRGLDEELAYLFSLGQRYGECFGLALIDLANFKQFNELHGHPAGDLLLKGVAQTLDDTMRDTDIVARYAGDEFVILLPRCDASAAGMAAARAQRVLVAATFQCGRNVSVRPAVNVGVTASLPGDTPDSMIRRADAAMFRSKAKGPAYLHDGKDMIELTDRAARLAPAVGRA